MEKLNTEETIKQYLKNHLTISIKEEYYGFNDKCLNIYLEIDGEIISSCSVPTR